jgi:hypothetical protein
MFSAYKLNTSRGMQSTGEALAKRPKHAVVESTGSGNHEGFTTNSTIRSLSKVYIEPGGTDLAATLQQPLSSRAFL